MIQDLLVTHLKKILLSAPLDIFSEEEETLSKSSYELVEARLIESKNNDSDEAYEYEDEDDNESDDFNRIIGSANLFIAASIVCEESTQGKTLSDLSEKDLDNFQTNWKAIINQLLGERFIRETQEVAHSKIKLIIDNKELPNIGVQI
jgi:hypothetical protein